MPLILPLLAGLLAALCCIAAYYFIYAVHDSLRKIPFFGNALANIVLTVLTSIVAFLESVWSSTARIWNGVFIRPASMFLSTLQSLGALAQQTATTTFWLANNLVQHVWDQLVARIAQTVHDVKAWTTHAVAVAAHDLRAGITAARHYAAGLVVSLHHTLTVALSDLRKSIDARFASVAAGATSVLAHAKAYAAGIVHDLRVDTTRAVNAAEAAAVAGIASAVKYTDAQVAAGIGVAETVAVKAAGGLVSGLDHAATAAVAAAWPGIIDAVDELEQVIATDLPVIGAAVRAIPRAVPTDLAAAIPAILAVAIPGIRYMSQCGVPNCRNLSAIGREIQGLIHVAEGGAFLAALVELIHDPQAVAREVRDVLGPVVDETTSGARQLLGV